MAAARKLKAVPPLKHQDLAAYPYTQCREQHIWMPFDGRLDEKRKIAYRIQCCANCPTMRKSELSLRVGDYGQLIKSSTYKYPKDYRIEGGIRAAELGRMRMANFMDELSNFAENKDNKET